jgi:hypothetical protein
MPRETFLGLATDVEDRMGMLAKAGARKWETCDE